MQEILCPSCGKSFTIDKAGYAEILKQVRDSEFEADIHERLAIAESEKQTAVQLAEAKIINELQKTSASKDSEIQSLKSRIEAGETVQKLAISEALSPVEKERDKLKLNLENIEQKKELSEKSIIEKYEIQLMDRDAAIERLRDMKMRLSTKMVGESLEQHCENEFNAIRALAFPNANFDKDNDGKSGSKGDYIFQDFDDSENELISIMFEMKNESDETKTKKKNADFYAELDKDRNEKKCEYAVLVTMLEPDNDLFNNGILDVSHIFPKMYVVRPQFFIPIIGVLKNAASKSLVLRNELAVARAQQYDITDFETKLKDWKTGFAKNFDLQSRKLKAAIAGIDESIKQLEKTKDALISSDNNHRLANEKLQDLSIKKLTKGNPTMIEKFAALPKGNKDLS